jgi:hypothetical protein
VSLRRFYNSATIGRLSESLGVDLKERDVALLGQWANVYLIFRHNVDHGPRASIREALKVLLDDSDPVARLKHLDDATLGLLAAAADRLPEGFPSEPVAHWRRAPGQVRLKLIDDYPNPVGTDIFRKCASLALVAFAERFPRLKGRRELFALRWYVGQLACFYVRLTGRIPRRAYDHRSTVNHETGRFLDFVTKALEPVDPKVASRCAWVVRQVCKDFNPSSSEGSQTP